MLEPELEGQLAEVYAAYVSELRGAFEEIGPWWTERSTALGREQSRLRWPGGPASHPRVIAVYRDYHARLTRLRPPLPEGPGPRFDDDAAWGSEAEPAPTSLIPPKPHKVLRDRLQLEAPDLYREMVELTMPPVGVPPEPAPTIRGLEAVEEPPRIHVAGFDFELDHDLPAGLRRLLGAGLDLRPRDIPNHTLADANEFHRLAYWSYLGDLERALREVWEWWETELRRSTGQGASPEQAAEQLREALPFGPVGHPRILGVIQAYWALCHELNAMLTDASQRVAPEAMLLGWLRDGTRETWVEVLSAMPYWPVAIDREGNWS